MILENRNYIASVLRKDILTKQAAKEAEYNFIKGYGADFELELIQTQMAQKPMLRAEVGMRVRCANKASAE
jgi:ribonuclease HII